MLYAQTYDLAALLSQTPPEGIFFRSQDAALGAAGVATLTIPSSVQTNDVMIISAAQKVATSVGTLTAPAGWTLLAAVVDGQGASYHHAVFGRVARPGDAGTAVTVTSTSVTQQVTACLAAYAGADGLPTAVGQAANGTSASTSVATASQGGSVGDVVVAFAGVRADTNGAQPSFTGPAGFTVRVTSSANSGGAQNVACTILDGAVYGAATITASTTVWSTAGQLVLTPFVSSNLGMVHRLYLANAAAGYTPATVRGGWDNAAATLVRDLGLAPAGAAATAGVAETAAGTGHATLLGRWVSAAAIRAGTMAGSMSWCAGVLQSDAAADLWLRLHVYVTEGDTDVVRGVLHSEVIHHAEMVSGAAAGQAGGDWNLDAVPVEIGDRIVVELGFEAGNAVTTSYTGTVNYGGTAAGDLTRGSTSVTTEPGWVAFSDAVGLFFDRFGDRIDTFSDGTLDAVQWAGSWSSGTPISETGGRARIPVATSYGALETVRRQYFRDTAVSWEWPTAPAAGGSTNAYVIMSVDAAEEGTYAGWLFDPVAGQLKAMNAVGWSDGSAVTLTYNGTTHRWLRVREVAGTTYWDTSSDGITWTNRRIAATPAWCRFKNNAFNVDAHRDDGTGDFTEIDFWNTGVVYPITGAVALSHTVTASVSATRLSTAPLQFGETLTRSGTAARTLAAEVLLNSGTSSSLAATRTLTHAVAVAAGTTRSATGSRMFTDTVIVTGVTVGSAGPLSRATTGTITVGDVTVRAVETSRGSDATLILVADTVRQGAAVGFTSGTLHLVTVLTSGTASLVSATNGTVGVSADTQLGAMHRTRAVTPTLRLSAEPIATMQMDRAVSTSTLVLISGTGRVVGHVRAVIAGLVLLDVDTATGWSPLTGSTAAPHHISDTTIPGWVTRSGSPAALVMASVTPAGVRRTV